MRPVLLSFLALLALAAGAFAQGLQQSPGQPVQPEEPPELEADTDPMPGVLYLDRTGTEHPFWVRADKVLMDGQPNPELFGPVPRSAVARAIARASVETCSPLRSPHEMEQGSQDLSDVIGDSQWVFVGRITGAADGLSDEAVPLTLLRVLPLQVLKGPNWTWEHFLTVPCGDLRVGGKRLCADQAAYPPSLRVGDRVLVLTDTHYPDGTLLPDIRLSSYLAAMNPARVLPIEGSSLRLSPAFASHQDLSWANETIDSWFERAAEGDRQ